MRGLRAVIFLFSGAAALVFLCTVAAHGPSMGRDAPHVVRVRFDDVGNLKARAVVSAAGVPIGRVRTIRFDDREFRAEATLEIDADVDVPLDSTAQILTAGLLGDQYVGIGMGSDAQMLRDGEALFQSQSALGLEALIARIIPGATDARKPGVDKPAR